MKARTLAVICLTVSTAAFAGPTKDRWVPLAGDAQAVFSVELSSIKPREPYLRAWVHTEWSQTQADGFIGYGTLNLVNCSDEEWALVQLIGYRDPMLGRPNVPVSLEPEFSMPPPGSAGAHVIQFVCAYAKGEKWTREVKTSPLPVSPSSLP